MKENKQEEKDKSENLLVTINNEKFEAEKKVFSTGKIGYGLYGRILINNYPYRICMNIIAM